MKLFKTFATAFCLVALYGLVIPVASADGWNRKTAMTFTGPVALQGGVKMPVSQVAQREPVLASSVALPNQVPKTASSGPELLVFALLCTVVGVILRRAAKRNAATITIPKK